MIDDSTMVIFGCMIAAGIILPTLFAFIWVKKTKQPATTIIIGAAIFFFFAVVLETLPKLVLLQASNPIGAAITSNVWLFSATAALLAGIFEETGRFIAFRYLLKNRNDRLTAISYGIGHGGFEAMYLLAVGGIQNIVYVTLIRTGGFDAIIAEVAEKLPQMLPQVEAIPAAIAAVNASTLALSLVERCAAVCIHIACSIIMFKAVKLPGKLRLWPVAILLHASVDMFAAFYQAGVIENVYALEAGIVVWGVCMLIFCVRRIYSRLPENIAAAQTAV